MLPNPTTDRMIAELRTLLADLEAGRQPSNPALEEVVRKRVRGQMLREDIDALIVK